MSHGLLVIDIVNACSNHIPQSFSIYVYSTTWNFAFEYSEPPDKFRTFFNKHWLLEIGNFLHHSI